jgi:tRNA A37 threonylcarbamoyladenosine synthetase subunit TsaC/SUA5/YrdC
MTEIIRGGVAHTHDAVPVAQLQAHAAQALDCIAGGGIVIVPLDVAYAIVGHAPDAIGRIFAAKQRSFDKPCGMFGAPAIAHEVHDLPPATLDLIGRLAATSLPFSIVAPVRAGHRFFAGTDPFTFARSSKNGTLDMLTNAGQWLAEIARQSWARGMPVFGSSANRSLAGSKYRLQDVEPEVLAAADLAFDYGTSRYATPEGLASSIIDFRDFSVVRIGHRFAEVEAAMADFGVRLRRN